MWRGDANLSDDQQSVRILGVPIGSAVLVRRQFEDKSVDQEMLFHRLQSVTTPTSGGVSRTILGSERDLDSAKVVSQLQVKSGSILVQLGGLHPHDQTTSPFSGRHFDHRHLLWPGAVFRTSQELSGHVGGSRVGDPIVEDVG